MVAGIREELKVGSVVCDKLNSRQDVNASVLVVGRGWIDWTATKKGIYLNSTTRTCPAFNQYIYERKRCLDGNSRPLAIVKASHCLK